MELTVYDLYTLCNRHQWFTCGSIGQYEKMFKIVERNKITWHDTEMIIVLSAVIWVCSDNKMSEEDIYDVIYQFAKEKANVV